MTFQVGDTVEYSNNTYSNSPLVLGERYTISKVTEEEGIFFLGFLEHPNAPKGWYDWRFKLVEPAASSKEYLELFL